MRALALVLMVIVTGCATTRVTDSWVDPEAQGRTVKRMLVVGLVPEETTRRHLEQNLVAEVEKQGIAAVPSNRYIDSRDNLTPAAIRNLAQQEGFDAVLISRFRGVHTEIEYDPGLGYDYAFGYPDPWYSGYVYEEREAVLETTLFESEAGGRMVWSVGTQTLIDGDMVEKTGDLADKVVERMTRDRVI